MKAIKGFNGEYSFLSNMYKCTIPFKEKFVRNNYYNEPERHMRLYESSEHIYQSFKAITLEDFILIANSKDPYETKRIGRSIEIDPEFSIYQIELMKDIVLAKFANNADILQKLLATGDVYIEETNTWRDTFWGVCDGYGHNHLGLILMDVRKEILEQ